ncbi:hypothetical protein [Paenarthrobacter sp. FR1]|uniref:hypothetical protein n=1 Tax=Paenarthrobacter sp. FR1 TaxID=3439548 RepID=UPI003DA1CE7B
MASTPAHEFFPAPNLDPWTSNFMCCLRVADVDELYGAMLRSGVPVAAAQPTLVGTECDVAAIGG